MNLRCRQWLRDVYRQFAANFGFGARSRWAPTRQRAGIGAAILLGLAVVGRAGLAERRESFMLTPGYSTVGLVWLEAQLLGSFAAS
jgi:hypothetical protein